MSDYGIRRHVEAPGPPPARSADPLKQACIAAGEVRTDAAIAYGIASIAADVRRLVDHITGTTPGDAQ